MSLPPLALPDDGNEYGPDLLGSPAVIGARNGLPSWRPLDTKAPIKLRMCRLKLTRGGLAANGARFRRPQPEWKLYHAESVTKLPRRSDSPPHDMEDGVVRIFVWGADRKAAKDCLRTLLPAVSFFR